VVFRLAACVDGALHLIVAGVIWIGADDPIACHAVHVHMARLASICEASGWGKVVSFATADSSDDKATESLSLQSFGDDLNNFAHGFWASLVGWWVARFIA